MMQHSDSDLKYVAEVIYSDEADCFGFSHCFKQFEGDNKTLIKILKEINNLEYELLELLK